LCRHIVYAGFFLCIICGFFGNPVCFPMKFSQLSLFLLLSGFLVSGASAAEASLDTGSTAWILTSTALVLFMTLPGLALFYGGLVRSKNVLSVLMQCFAIAGLASILWLVAGYSLAFGEGNAWIGDFSKVLMAGVGRETLSGEIPESIFMLFQMTFAIITPALVVGGFAERMKFSSMLLFSGLWLMLVYVPVTHWVWGGGWLGSMGLYDFAGGTVVHITAGVAALVAALVLGPRRGFPESPMMPHNMTMTVSGAGMLWVGWFGYPHLGGHGRHDLDDHRMGAFRQAQRPGPGHRHGGGAWHHHPRLGLRRYGFAEGIHSMGQQLWVQFIGVVATLGFTVVMTWVILKVVSVVTSGLRVEPDQEQEGLDIVLHEERGYDIH